MGGNDILNSNSITMKPLTNAELTSRLLKAEKALSETMGQVHELDNIVCGLLHRIHRLEKPACPPRPVFGHLAFMQKPAPVNHCPKCGGYGWQYDSDFRSRSVCPCHY